jgi:hypothetical protein
LAKVISFPQEPIEDGANSMWQIPILEAASDKAPISLQTERQKLHKAPSHPIAEPPDVAK